MGQQAIVDAAVHDGEGWALPADVPGDVIDQLAGDGLARHWRGRWQLTPLGFGKSARFRRRWPAANDRETSDRHKADMAATQFIRIEGQTEIYDVIRDGAVLGIVWRSGGRWFADRVNMADPAISGLTRDEVVARL